MATTTTRKLKTQVPGETEAQPEELGEAENSSRSWDAADTEALDPVEGVQRASGELPDAADIDPATISRAVLTRQGWVCPEARG